MVSLSQEAFASRPEILRIDRRVAIFPGNFPVAGPPRLREIPDNPPLAALSPPIVDRVDPPSDECRRWWVEFTADLVDRETAHDALLEAELNEELFGDPLGQSFPDYDPAEFAEMCGDRAWREMMETGGGEAW